MALEGHTMQYTALGTPTATICRGPDATILADYSDAVVYSQVENDLHSRPLSLEISRINII